MKIYTEPQTGLSWALMSTSDRQTLAKAKSVLEMMAHVNRHHQSGAQADEAAERIEALLQLDAEPEPVA